MDSFVRFFDYLRHDVDESTAACSGIGNGNNNKNNKNSDTGRSGKKNNNSNESDRNDNIARKQRKAKCVQVCEKESQRQPQQTK